MKKLNLDETWVLCLKMWRWIAKQKRNGSRKLVFTLKREWLIKNIANKKDWPTSDYYFCEYFTQNDRGGLRWGYASGCCCPGNRIDKKFDCYDPNYCFCHKPIEFYKKLLELNRKRKKKNEGQRQKGKRLSP